MSPAPRVSVVVPTAGSRALLERCLVSLRGQRYRDFETIVVDNAAGRESLQLPGIRVVELEPDAGFATAANAGANAAVGAYLAFLNDDVEAGPDWLGELVACLERHPRAAAVDSKVLRREDTRILDGAGDAMTLALKAYRRGQGRPDDGSFDAEEQVFSASGTACLWRADVFRELGGFDETFFAYYEDVDLGFRARRAGHECWYAPRAVVVHRGSATAGRRWREFESYHALRNRWAMIARNAPTRWLLRYGHWILAGELLSLARAAAVGDLGPAVRAYRDAAGPFRGRWSRRRSEGEVALGDLLGVVTRPLPPAATSLWRLRLARRLRDGRGVA